MAFRTSTQSLATLVTAAALALPINATNAQTQEPSCSIAMPQCVVPEQATIQRGLPIPPYAVSVLGDKGLVPVGQLSVLTQGPLRLEARSASGQRLYLGTAVLNTNNQPFGVRYGPDARELVIHLPSADLHVYGPHGVARRDTTIAGKPATIFPLGGANGVYARSGIESSNSVSSDAVVHVATFMMRRTKQECDKECDSYLPAVIPVEVAPEYVAVCDCVDPTPVIAPPAPKSLIITRDVVREVPIVREVPVETKPLIPSLAHIEGGVLGMRHSGIIFSHYCPDEQHAPFIIGGPGLWFSTAERGPRGLFRVDAAYVSTDESVRYTDGKRFDRATLFSFRSEAMLALSSPLTAGLSAGYDEQSMGLGELAYNQRTILGRVGFLAPHIEGSIGIGSTHRNVLNLIVRGPLYDAQLRYTNNTVNRDVEARLHAYSFNAASRSEAFPDYGESGKGVTLSALLGKRIGASAFHATIGGDVGYHAIAGEGFPRREEGVRASARLGLRYVIRPQ